MKVGYQIPFLQDPPLSKDPILFSSYHHSSIKGQALELELDALVDKGAVEPSTGGPGFYSRMFVVRKASGSWRPIIDLSTLNGFVQKTKFKMETVQSVLASIRQDDWMFSLDLQDAYLQIPIHPESRPYLRFSTVKGTFQFKVLCFGLSTAPQVFTRVMAPVSVILHQLGIRLLRYIDDWLILASSKEECLRAREILLELCMTLGIRINFQKSHLSPSQVATYLGIDIYSQTLTASPTVKRQDTLLLIIEEFLSLEAPPASLWRSLLGHLSSLTQLIPRGRLRMRSLQIQLKNLWDFQDDSVLIPWNQSCHQDLLWWIQGDRLSQGISLKTISPDQMLWSDASDQGWGAFLHSEARSGLWSEEEKLWSINRRELRAILMGLQSLESLLDPVIGILCDNSTAVAYLRNQGGTRSLSTRGLRPFCVGQRRERLL